MQVKLKEKGKMFPSMFFLNNMNLTCFHQT